MKEYKELIIDYGDGIIKQIEPPKLFSGAYVDTRNRLIPNAENYADKKIPNAKTDQQKSDWNLAFHSKMNELAAYL